MPLPIAAITVSALIALAPTQAERNNATDLGRWNLTVDNKSQGEPTVHLMLFSPGLNTLTLSAGELDGFPLVDGRSSTGDIEFQLNEDAGTLKFYGRISGQRGVGVFTFSPSAEFARELVRRGMQRPTAPELFNLARHQVRLSVLDELVANGYTLPTTLTLVEAGFHSIDTRFIRQMSELGYRMTTLDELIQMRKRGVDPDYIRALAKLGYVNLSAQSLMAMASQGIDAAFIRSINARASRRLSPSELVTFRIRGSRA